ncbi:MAG: hypothetical protein QF834_07305 [Candidatus Thalassarchaeaceae archaeon]|nr:hypothetical protein [Candidatus Thalassarchaeaceae archaeon]
MSWTGPYKGAQHEFSPRHSKLYACGGIRWVREDATNLVTIQVTAADPDIERPPTTIDIGGIPMIASASNRLTNLNPQIIRRL